MSTARIYIGGLGANVTADDLRNTFSNLGVVDSLDIIRTKDRSFAYLDFLPSSDKSLSKLFSTYNGCVWKGGRLRLEKAKEHYLLRLKREWEEDAKIENNAPSSGVGAAKEMGSLENSKKVLKPEKMDLRLFFPKLQKMKSLPFGGTGKHKYSFQRVQVPPLPTHFCDCEEHSGPVYTRQEKYVHDLERQSGGVNEEELKMMNSVMYKLFERDNVSKSAFMVGGLATVEDNSVSNSAHIGDELGLVEDNSTKIDNMVIDEEVDHVEDEDNLIMNMVVGGNDRMSLRGSWGHEIISANEEPIFDEPQTSIGRSAQNMPKSQKGKILASNKKRKLPLTKNDDGNAPTFAIPERKRSLQSDLSKSETVLEGQIRKPESSIVKSNAKRSWSQKSAWKDLVGEARKNPFHVTDIMQSDAAIEVEQPNSDDLGVHDFTGSENQSTANHETLEIKSSESKELKGRLLDVEPSKPIELVNKSARGASWLQKSSWTQLVSEINHNPFSISQILPDITFEKHDLQAPNSMDVANSAGGDHGNLVETSNRSESSRDGSKAVEVANEDIHNARNISTMFSLAMKGQNHAGEVEQHSPEKNLQTIGEKKEASAPTLDRKDHMAISETCTFMRNADSMREWAKTKSALSGSAKRKANEKLGS